MGRDDPKRCNQIKIMPFIQTSLAQSQSASPKATTLYLHNMWLFLVPCLLNRWERASSARCLRNKARGLTTSRTSKSPCPDSADVIEQIQSELNLHVLQQIRGRRVENKKLYNCSSKHKLLRVAPCNRFVFFLAIPECFEKQLQKRNEVQ